MRGIPPEYGGSRGASSSRSSSSASPREQSILSEVEALKAAYRKEKKKSTVVICVASNECAPRLREKLETKDHDRSYFITALALNSLMTRLKRAAGDGRLARNSSLTILVSDQVPRLNRFSVTEHIRKLVVRRVTKCPQSQDYGKLVLDASSTFAGMRLDSWRQGNRSTNPPIFRTEGNVDILPASGGDVYPPNEESILSTGSVLSIAAGAVTGAAIGMATGCGAAGIAPLVAAGVVTAGVLYWVPWRKWFGKKEASEPGDEHGKEEHEKRPTPPANPAETTGPTTGDNIKTFLTSTVISGIVSYGASYMVMLVIAKGGAAYLTYFAWIAGPLALAYAIYVTPWNKIFTWMQTKYRIRESSVRRFFGMANASHGRNCL